MTSLIDTLLGQTCWFYRFLQYTTSVPKTAPIYVKVLSCRSLTRFCMFNLHTVTQLEAKSNVSNRYILKLWVSNTKELDLLIWEMMNRKFVMKNLQRGCIFAELFIDKKVENWKKKKSPILVYPMTDFFFMNGKIYFIWLKLNWLKKQTLNIVRNICNFKFHFQLFCQILKMKI